MKPATHESWWRLTLRFLYHPKGLGLAVPLIPQTLFWHSHISLTTAIVRSRVTSFSTKILRDWKDRFKYMNKKYRKLWKFWSALMRAGSATGKMKTTVLLCCGTLKFIARAKVNVSGIVNVSVRSVTRMIVQSFNYICLQDSIGKSEIMLRRRTRGSWCFYQYLQDPISQ